MVGFGLPTHRHSKVILVPSSDCLMTGLSVNVGLIKSSGTGASSPISVFTLVEPNFHKIFTKICSFFVYI